MKENMPKFNDPKQTERFQEFYRQEEEDLMKTLADRYDIPYIDLSKTPINTDALRLVDEKRARDAGMAAFSITGKKVHIAIVSPKNNILRQVAKELERKGYEVFFHLASQASLEKAWSRYEEISRAEKTEAGMFNISHRDVVRLSKEIKTIEDLRERIEKTVETAKRYKTSRILEIILAGAIAVNASDVHIEPEEDNARLRLRLDGVLHDFLFFKRDLYTFLLSRIKLLSGLKLNVKKSAQDGRLSIKMETGEIEVRTSILPGAYGESIVLRILDPETLRVSFEDLGIEEVFIKRLKQEIKKPNGMILTTGPTGSGKTTTLYSFLREIYSPGIKIITIEDPIEYHIEGITQTQTDASKDYTFLTGLRSALRQDPDIIMVGEIRDAETAQVAVHAALTGHLVFSTLHTNNAYGIIPRLIDIGINPKIISSALNVGLAQRLVRRLCDDCKKKVKPTKDEHALIKEIIQGIKKKREIDVDTSHIWKANGKTETGMCLSCNGLGYKGRIGVFEGLFMDGHIEKVIVTENPSEREMKKAAHKQNVLNMQEDGILKVLNGVTSLEELGRVVDLSEDDEYE